VDYRLGGLDHTFHEHIPELQREREAAYLGSREYAQVFWQIGARVCVCSVLLSKPLRDAGRALSPGHPAIGTRMKRVPRQCAEFYFFAHGCCAGRPGARLAPGAATVHPCHFAVVSCASVKSHLLLLAGHSTPQGEFSCVTGITKKRICSKTKYVSLHRNVKFRRRRCPPKRKPSRRFI
jgi:hypothetical protein